jgi:Phosphodiester glycosidase
VMVHIIAIDLTTPGIKPFVSPGFTAEPWWGNNAYARTVSESVAEFDLQLAINANFFHPFMEGNPWDYYPGSGDPVHNIGQSTSNSNTYSRAQISRPALCFLDRNRVQILVSGSCPEGTIQAVAGKEMLVENSQPVPQPEDVIKADKPYPRTVAALDQSGRTLWLVAVDGKQFRYSEGLKQTEMADLMLNLGADSAFNLDGGGSVALAIQTRSGVKVLNAPIQTRIPMRERPVSNQLGFFAKQLDQP